MKVKILLILMQAFFSCAYANSQIEESVQPISQILTAEVRIKLYEHGSHEVFLTKSSGDPQLDAKILRSVKEANFKKFQEDLHLRYKYVEYPVYFTQPFKITAGSEEIKAGK